MTDDEPSDGAPNANWEDVSQNVSEEPSDPRPVAVYEHATGGVTVQVHPADPSGTAGESDRWRVTVGEGRGDERPAERVVGEWDGRDAALGAARKFMTAFDDSGDVETAATETEE